MKIEIGRGAALRIFAASMLFCGIVWSAKKWFSCVDMKLALGKKNIVPVAVIGSGPAGLTAALYTARAHLPTVVFTGQDIGGQMTEARYVENWPSKRKDSGANIMKDMEEQVKHFGAHLLHNQVTEVNFNVWPYELLLDNDDRVHALSVIIATGGVQKKLNIPGVQEFWGKGIGICSICDAPFDKGKEVALLGSTDITCDMALQLKEFAKHVYVLVPGSHMEAAAINQKYLKETPNISVFYNVRVAQIKGEKDKVSSVVFDDRQTGEQKELPIQSFYFAIGFIPNTALFKKALLLNKDNYIQVDQRQQTSKKLIYAAGTVIDSLYQKGLISAAMGAQAAIQLIEQMQVCGFTDDLERKLEPSYYKINEKEELIQKATTLQEVNALIKFNGIVVAEFYGQNCPSCKAMAPVAEQIAKEYKDRVKFIKADMQEISELVDELKLKKIPTFCIFANGKEIARQDSIADRKALAALLDDAIQKNKE